MDHHSLSKVEKLEKASLRSDLEKAALLEEISWRQKSDVVFKGGRLQYEVLS